MSVTIDDLPLEAGNLGMATVGDVLNHVAKDNRLVVQLLIDGFEPDLGGMEVVRARKLADCTLFLETARPTQIARDALEGIDATIEQAETLRLEAAELFRSGDPAVGLQKLAACFSLWHNTQDSVGKIAKLLRVDLALVKTADGRAVKEIIEGFAGQLRQLRDALEARDYVLCCDVLTYDMEGIAPDWRSATGAMRVVAGG